MSCLEALSKDAGCDNTSAWVDTDDLEENSKLLREIPQVYAKILVQ